VLIRWKSLREAITGRQRCQGEQDEGSRVHSIGAKLFLHRMDCGRFTEKNEHRTSNVQPWPSRLPGRASNVEWEKMKKQTYDLEERLLKEKMNIEHRTSNIER
jgi:hypothetical protein